MAIRYAAATHPYILYDGFNSAEVLEGFEQLKPSPQVPAIISETGGVLTIEVTNPGNPTDTWVIPQGHRAGPVDGNVISPSDWETKWSKA